MRRFSRLRRLTLGDNALHSLKQAIQHAANMVSANSKEDEETAAKLNARANTHVAAGRSYDAACARIERHGRGIESTSNLSFGQPGAQTVRARFERTKRAWRQY